VPKPTQRNLKKQPEMEPTTTSAAASKKSKVPRKSKNSPVAKEQAIGGGSTETQQEEFQEETQETPETQEGIPEGGLSIPLTQTQITPPDITTEIDPEHESSLRYCPVCDNYLYMQVDAESQELRRICRKCGFKEDDAKGGLVMEMMVQQKSSEGYKILLNEFTRKDPRLPHIRSNITCPNTVCDSNKGGKNPDVIYIKYDNVNLMYLYICDICGDQWHSRNRA
jgi:DNA-directed RNA polymerase subunit M/transcription elongation factor TFIIS